jgi:thymidylate synthase (FAD)
MRVELKMSTPEEQIAESATVCYASKPREGLVKSLVHKQKHLAVLRFAYATVYVEGISVACQNQVVRSKHLDFMVQSKRYVNPDKGEFEFIMPEHLEDDTQMLLKNHFEASMNLYSILVATGTKKEDARAILPMNTSTKMYITGNLQSWDSFLKLRLNSKAQAEIRELADNIFDLLSEKFPNVFTDKELYYGRD